MKVSTRRIRELLEDGFPLIDWLIVKVRKKEQWKIHGSIYRNILTKELVLKENLFEDNIEELHAVFIMNFSNLNVSFEDSISAIEGIGEGFYEDMRRKDREQSSNS